MYYLFFLSFWFIPLLRHCLQYTITFCYPKGWSSNPGTTVFNWPFAPSKGNTEKQVFFILPQLLFDGHLSSVISFSYNAKAVDGQLCLEASPNENPSPFTHSPHATLLEGVEPVVTTPFHTILHSLGGVQVSYTAGWFLS